MKLLEREEVLEREDVLEKEPAEITREVEPKRAIERPVDDRRLGWKPVLAVVLVAAAIAAIAIAVVTSGGGDTVTELDEGTSPSAQVEISNWPYTEEEITLMELAIAGYIPMEAVDWQLMDLKELVLKGYVPAESLIPQDWQRIELERLVERGYVPAESLRAAVPPVRPLHTPAEIELLQLARAGNIPMEAVDWQRMELIDLVARGHVPREALVDLGRPLLPPGAQPLPVELNNVVLELYRENHVPREAVDWQLLELVDLVNLRHVPPESLYTTG